MQDSLAVASRRMLTRTPSHKKRQSQAVLESFLVVFEMGEGERHLVHIAQGPMFHAKVYEEPDYTFHVVFTSDDFGSRAAAVDYIEKITKGLRNG